MTAAISITYLHHSGFAARMQDTLLIFDDAREAPDDPEATLATGYVTPSLIAAHKQTYVFVSHAHSDHFNPRIYDLSAHGDVTYILGYDVPEPHEGIRMKVGDTFSRGDLQVIAYGSTDEGVSFMVQIGAWTLFHAGDLNLWHWREESTLKEIEDAEIDYLETVAPILGQPIDFAFFPLDPRMGEMYDAGALHFLMHAKPRVMIPMHWWDRSSAATDFARRNKTGHVEIVPLITPGETIQAQKDAAGHITLIM